jgi:hypothetical protein
MLFLVRETVYGGAIPAFVTMVLLMAGRRGKWSGASAWDAVAVAAGYLVGHFYVHGFPRLPVVGLLQALPFIIGLAAVWAFVDVREGMPWVVRLAGRLILTLATGHIFDQPMMFYASGLGSADVARAAIYALIALVIWAAADALAARVPAYLMAPAWLAATGGLSLSLLAAQSGLLSQLAGALAGCLGGVTLVAFWRPKLRVTALAPVVALLWFSFSALGLRYELPVYVVALLAGAAFLPGGVSGLAVWLSGVKRGGGGAEKTSEGHERFWREHRLSQMTLVLSVVASVGLSAGAVMMVFRRFGPPPMF